MLSRGTEEHAGFSTQSARATTDAADAYRIVLACELVAALRALRLRGIRPVGPVLLAAFERAASALSPDTADRPLDGDLAVAQRLLPSSRRWPQGLTGRLPRPCRRVNFGGR